MLKVKISHPLLPAVIVTILFKSLSHEADTFNNDVLRLTNGMRGNACPIVFLTKLKLQVQIWTVNGGELIQSLLVKLYQVHTHTHTHTHTHRQS